MFHTGEVFVIILFQPQVRRDTCTVFELLVYNKKKGSHSLSFLEFISHFASTSSTDIYCLFNTWLFMVSIPLDRQNSISRADYKSDSGSVPLLTEATLKSFRLDYAGF